MAKDLSKKTESPETRHGRPIGRLLRRLIHAPAALAILWPAVLFCASYLAWQHWGADRVAAGLYGVDPSLLQINASPDYIREDIVATVYRDTALDELSLLEPQATAKIASAFSLHPWIRRVVSVRKLPGGEVEVLAEFRRPVAMVIHRESPPTAPMQTTSQLGTGELRASAAGGNRGVSFLPVDGEGIVLPTDDFARSETRNYIHIDVPGVTTSQKFVGSPYGDRRVEAAARLAAVLADYRDRAQIKSIAIRGELRGEAVPQLELTTFDGKRLFWGSPPGREREDEAVAAMKMRRLLEGADADADLRIGAGGRQ